MWKRVRKGEFSVKVKKLVRHLGRVYGERLRVRFDGKVYDVSEFMGVGFAEGDRYVTVYHDSAIVCSMKFDGETELVQEWQANDDSFESIIESFCDGLPKPPKPPRKLTPAVPEVPPRKRVFKTRRDPKKGD